MQQLYNLTVRSELSLLSSITDMHSFITCKISTIKYLVESQVQTMLAWSSHCASPRTVSWNSLAGETVLEMELELSSGWLQRCFMLQKRIGLILAEAAIDSTPDVLALKTYDVVT